ncbi:MAG TPA: hypothetical protein VME43_03325 [Bryobacteraceae bacterium]|nr:hypothetical protein [Bryobacteraceae bacterium]
MNRTSPSPPSWELAQRLLAYETASGNPSVTRMSAAVRVSEKLRRRLVTLAGVAGFCALLHRALALSKAQVPGLSKLSVRPDGSLEGLNELHDDDAAQAGAMLIAELIELLTTFIGEHLTLILIHDVWPDLAESGERTNL